jgi:hypothetical protein
MHPGFKLAKNRDLVDVLRAALNGTTGMDRSLGSAREAYRDWIPWKPLDWGFYAL